MNTERLIALAAHLRNVPEDDFNIKHWKCESTACAVGHACTMPQFQELGLRLELFNEHGSYVLGTPAFVDPKAGTVTRDWVAVQKFFDLTADQAEHLFWGEKYYAMDCDPSANDVADRITDLVYSAVS